MVIKTVGQTLWDKLRPKGSGRLQRRNPPPIATRPSTAAFAVPRIPSIAPSSPRVLRLCPAPRWAIALAIEAGCG